MKQLLFLALLLNASFTIAYTHWGKTVSIGKGHARTFVTKHGHKVKEVGIAISPAGLKNLGMQMKEYLLPLPAGVKVYPYKHVTLDWNPHGHEPENVYDMPHFDMHFYFISNSMRQLITCMNEDAATCMQGPGESYVPYKYAPTPAGVPKMGWHWVDLLSPEFNGGEFTRTFIYGYYNGTMIFVEPMVTLEYLKSKMNSVKEVRRPEDYPYQHGSFPGQYRIYYDVKNKYHKIVLKKMLN